MITLREMADLSVLYGQKHRHYHDITHIQNCLAELEAVCAVDEVASRYRSIIEQAIWYHDAVYNPYSKENEYNSANLLSEDCGVVRDIILMTAHHTETQTFKHFSSTYYEHCAKVMLDIDLAGFGKGTIEFIHNSEDIRREYYNTIDSDFYKGRLNFMKAISERDSLYYTNWFKTMYHEKSRENLEGEIELCQYKLDEIETGLTRMAE